MSGCSGSPVCSLIFWLSLVAISITFQVLYLSQDSIRHHLIEGNNHRTTQDSLNTDLPFSILQQQQQQQQDAGDSKGNIKVSIPKFHVDPIYKEQHDQIDNMSNEERCSAFGVQPHNESSPRRIFFGSMLADENWDVLKMNAIEVHGLYEVMALIESNTTHAGTPRPMRFHKNSKEALTLQHSTMFGNETRVIIDYWLKDMPGLRDMNREVEQRNTIVKVWKEAGMTERDIGIMADLDEIVSRNFLKALQVCDFPKLRVVDEPSCYAPKMVLSTLSYESSPFCIKKNSWYHPDVILVSLFAD